MKIQWWPADKIPELQHAIDEHWRRGHVLARDEALVRWQYRNPHDPGSLSILRADDESLAGLLGVIHVDFNIFGRRVPGLWLAMWFATQTAPKVTGLALLRAAMEANTKMIACLGFNDNAERIYRGLRFTVVDEVPRWICVTNAETFRALIRQADPNNEFDLQALIDTASIGPRQLSDPLVRLIPWNETLAERWNRKWTEDLSTRTVGTWRDFDYLRWRYIEHPTFKYHVHFAENNRDGALSGLVVFRYEPVAPSGFTVVRIVELLGDDATCTVLAAAVKEEAKASGAAFIDLFCTYAALARPLEAVGFVRERSIATPIPMLFQPLDNRRTRVRASYTILDPALEERALSDREALYITRSDGDQDRPN